MSFRNGNSSLKLVQFEQIEKHLKSKVLIMLNLFLIGKKTIEMGVETNKNRFTVDSSDKFVSFLRLFYI